MMALEAGAAGGVAAPTVQRTHSATLDFLQPPTDNAYLGRLAHFDVMRLIGRGGMGMVLEAFDTRLQRHVAIKVLDPALADDEVARQRFCREARAAASITHENVVAVHQVEKFDDGRLAYMIMQLVAGESLEQRLVRQSRLPLREVVRIGMQAAHGLAAAHAQGLIHRDVKPGNILLEPPSDRVKLTDFGIARVADDVKLTQTGYVSGTPLYMAPEQALGNEPDPRSDLFSLGAILYEMCAGRPPFQGNSALAILKQITDAKPQPIRELNPQTPEWLAETIDRLLAKKPDDRFQSAVQLAEVFEFYWAVLKTSSEDLPTVCQEEERRQTIRNRWIAAAIGTAFLAVGLVGGRFLFNRGGDAAAPGAGTVTPAVASSAPPTAVLAAKAGAVWSVSFDAAGDTVAMAVEDGSVRLWDLPTKSTKATLGGHRGTVWVSLFSPSGRRLMTAGNDSLIKIWDAAKPDSPVTTLKHDQTVRGAAFSHDEQTLFAADEGGVIRAWNLETSQPIGEAEQSGTVYAVALSPDGTTLATAGSDKTVRLWNAKTLSQKLPLEGHAGPIYGLSFHPAGGRLASVGWDKTVRIWDSASGSLLKSWEAHSGDVWSVAYSSDGAKLVTGGTDGAVKLWDAETGELLATFLGHPSAVHTVAFSRDGAQIASGGRDGAVRIWPVR
jgi:WD40 repeat protein